MKIVSIFCNSKPENPALLSFKIPGFSLVPHPPGPSCPRYPHSWKTAQTGYTPGRCTCSQHFLHQGRVKTAERHCSSETIGTNPSCEPASCPDRPRSTRLCPLASQQTSSGRTLGLSSAETEKCYFWTWHSVPCWRDQKASQQIANLSSSVSRPSLSLSSSFSFQFLRCWRLVRS